jgi:lipooligosaccharide transport system permease protein
MKELWSYLRPAVDWRSWAFLRRNSYVFIRNWKTVLVPPALEPIIFFIAFAMGLTGYVHGIQYGGHTLRYATYVAPGLIAYTGFGTPFYEALYAAYVRMFYQKTWDGILATQIELSNVVWGEILWSALRGAINVACVCLVLALCDAAGFIDVYARWLLVLPFLAFVMGIGVAAFGLIFTAIVPGIDHMNYPVFLIAWPLSLVSNTFFPFDTSHLAIKAFMTINPIYQLAECSRGLLVNQDPGPHLMGLLFSSLLFLLPCIFISTRLIRRRVLGG